MGQRSQIIVKLPRYYINDGNPNNREEEYLIFHNQWLYGFGFLKHLSEIMDIFTTIKEDWKNSDLNRFTPDYRDMIENAIKCANYKDPTNIRRTHLYGVSEGEINDNKFIAKRGSWEAVFSHLDNNNGFIFLKIDDDGSISYDILNGLEDDDEIKRRTPQEYLSLFWDKEEQEKFKKDIEKIYSVLDKYDQFDYSTLEMPKTKYKITVNVSVEVMADSKAEAIDLAVEKMDALYLCDHAEVEE